MVPAAADAALLEVFRYLGLLLLPSLLHLLNIEPLSIYSLQAIVEYLEQRKPSKS